jgi:hypothetical protein
MLSKLFKRETVQSDRPGSCWNAEIAVVIGPHLELSDSHSRTIEVDYRMDIGSTKMTVRRALLFYSLKRLGLDTDSAVRRPQAQQFVLLNASEAIG